MFYPFKWKKKNPTIGTQDKGGDSSIKTNIIIFSNSSACSIIFIYFLIRILALEENFLLQFQMDVSIVCNILSDENMRLIISLISYVLLFIWIFSSAISVIFSKACSKEERKRDFDKIFAHYDVVSTVIHW